MPIASSEPIYRFTPDKSGNPPDAIVVLRVLAAAGKMLPQAVLFAKVSEITGHDPWDAMELLEGMGHVCHPEPSVSRNGDVLPGSPHIWGLAERGFLALDLYEQANGAPLPKNDAPTAPRPRGRPRKLPVVPEEPPHA